MRTRMAVVTATVSAAVGLPATAALVVFDNADLMYRFQAWDPPFGEGNTLDITRGPSVQVGNGPRGVFWNRGMTFSSTDVAGDDLLGGTASWIAAGTAEFTVFGGPSGDTPFTFVGVRVYEPGESVGANADFAGFGASMGAHGNSAGQHWFLGEEAYAGVRLGMGDGFHYGWIRLRLVPALSGGGEEYQPVAWGYEATRDTPAPVPGPGVLGPLGLLLVLRRRGR